MIDPKPFQELSEKISALIAASPARDVEKNLRAMLSGAFTKLDLVTREEFDVQREVLARTRQKLSELEARIAALEAGNPTPPTDQ
jgi:BMFP domain-containing protein YqiC